MVTETELSTFSRAVPELNVLAACQLEAPTLSLILFLIIPDKKVRVHQYLCVTIVQPGTARFKINFGLSNNLINTSKFNIIKYTTEIFSCAQFHI